MYKAIVSLPSSIIATDIILLVSAISLLRDVGIDSWIVSVQQKTSTTSQTSMFNRRVPESSGLIEMYRVIYKIKRYYIVEIRDLEVELIKGVSTASVNAFRIIF